MTTSRRKLLKEGYDGPLLNRKCDLFPHPYPEAIGVPIQYLFLVTGAAWYVTSRYMTFWVFHCVLTISEH